jgi:hypothetical protein
MRNSTFVKSAFVAIALSLAAASSARPAYAQAAEPFGQAHQLAISADFDLSMQGYSQSKGGSSSSLLLAPAVDYFVIDHLSVGGQVIFAIDQGSHTTFGVKPRVGYNIPIIPALSFWPDAFVAFTTTSGDRNQPSTNVFSIGVYAPLLWHPTSHFFLGLGPDLSTELTHDPDGNRLTQYGIQSTVGGWLPL